jgi:hypothetical protein
MAAPSTFAHETSSTAAAASSAPCPCPFSCTLHPLRKGVVWEPSVGYPNRYRSNNSITRTSVPTNNRNTHERFLYRSRLSTSAVTYVARADTSSGQDLQGSQGARAACMTVAHQSTSRILVRLLRSCVRLRRLPQHRL